MRRAIVCVLLAAAGCNPPVREGKPAAPAASAPVKIVAAKPVRQAMKRIVDQPGSIQPFDETELFARVGGYVGRIHADIGKKVRGPRYDEKGDEKEPGEILAEIAVPELEQEWRQKTALVAQAQAEAEQAKKTEASAEANVALHEAKVHEAKAGIAKATALVDRWESEAKRTAKLAGSGVLDSQTAEETQNQRRAAVAALEEARARVVAAEAASRKAAADRDRAFADTKTAEAHVAVAAADAKRVEALWNFRYVRAPFDGVVTRRRVSTGHYLQPSQGKGEGLFVVACLDPVRLVFQVPETSAGWVAEGSDVGITIQASQGLHLNGKVSRTSWTLDPGSRTLRAEIDMKNPEGRLRPGMYLYAHVAADLPKEWTLPAAAVAKAGDEHFCFLIEGGKAVRTPLQVGAANGEWTQVPRRRGPDAAWVEWTGSESVAAKAAGLIDGQSVTIEP